MATAAPPVVGLELARQIDQSFDGARDDVGSAAPAVSPAGSGRIYFDSGTNKYQVSQNGSPYVDLVGGGGFAQGGNSFGATAVLGTNDAFPLELEVAGVSRVRLETTGVLNMLTNQIHGGSLTNQDLVVKPNAAVPTSGSFIVMGAAGGTTEMMRVGDFGGAGGIVSRFLLSAGGTTGEGTTRFFVNEDGFPLPVATGFLQSVYSGNKRLTWHLHGPTGAAASVGYVCTGDGSTSVGGDSIYYSSAFADASLAGRYVVRAFATVGGLLLRTENATPIELATGGLVRYRVASGGNLTMNGDFDIVPAVDNTGEVGTDALRFTRGRFVTVVTGDLELRGDDGSWWTVREGAEGIFAMDRRTGERWKLLMERSDE